VSYLGKCELGVNVGVLRRKPEKALSEDSGHDHDSIETELADILNE
jgi:hypothetical protein